MLFNNFNYILLIWIKKIQNENDNDITVILMSQCIMILMKSLQTARLIVYWITIL